MSGTLEIVLVAYWVWGITATVGITIADVHHTRKAFRHSPERWMKITLADACGLFWMTFLWGQIYSIFELIERIPSSVKGFVIWRDQPK